MEFKEARDLVIAAFKEVVSCNHEADTIIVVGANNQCVEVHIRESSGTIDLFQSVEVHIRESNGAIELFSKLNGVEGSSFFKHIKLACMTADQAKEAGKSIANFCFSTLGKVSNEAH